jgi:hypothetical protein
MQPDDDEDNVHMYHESPTLIDLSPEDERFMMNLSDVVGTLKPRGLLFDEEPESPPPLGKFKVFHDVSTPEKDPNIAFLKDLQLEIFTGGKKKVVLSPVVVLELVKRRYTLKFHTVGEENATIRVVPFLTSFKSVPEIRDRDPVIERMFAVSKGHKPIVIVSDINNARDLIVFKLGETLVFGISKTVLGRWTHRVVKYENIGNKGVDLELTTSRRADRVFIERLVVTLNV